MYLLRDHSKPIVAGIVGVTLCLRNKSNLQENSNNNNNNAHTFPSPGGSRFSLFPLFK